MLPLINVRRNFAVQGDRAEDNTVQETAVEGNMSNSNYR